jgi:hypothetical protein
MLVALALACLGIALATSRLARRAPPGSALAAAPEGA